MEQTEGGKEWCEMKLGENSAPIMALGLRMLGATREVAGFALQDHFALWRRTWESGSWSGT